MIIQRLKKLREDKLNRKAEKAKYATCAVILSEISKYFEAHPTENKMFMGNNAIDSLGKFDEVYAMNMDFGKPYIINKKYDKYGLYLEVTYKEEYRPELYY